MKFNFDRFIVLVFLCLGACNEPKKVLSNKTILLFENKIDTLKVEINQLKKELDKCDKMLNITEENK